MDKTSFHLSMLCFRSRVLAWFALTILVFSLAPSFSFAQQPSATISAVTGTVVVNGQKQGKGAVLRAGDVIETWAGASAVLTLSDGSQIELYENTKLDLAELTQTASGARVSRVKIAWGWIQAKISPRHQGQEASFDIETPNALVGVKFSDPTVRVGYILERMETRALGISAALLVEHPPTGQRRLVQIGSTAIVTATGIKLISGLVTEPIGAKSSGLGTVVKAFVGIGIVAGAGVGAYMLITEENAGDGDNNRFTGTFTGSLDNEWRTLVLNQNGDRIQGIYRKEVKFYCCTADDRVEIQGTIDSDDRNRATLSWDDKQISCTCYNEPFSDYIYGGSYTAVLGQNGENLRIEDEGWAKFPLSKQ